MHVLASQTDLIFSDVIMRTYNINFALSAITLETKFYFQKIRFSQQLLIIVKIVF